MSDLARDTVLEPGLLATELVRRLPALAPDVRAFRLVAYRPSPSLADRLRMLAGPAAHDVLVRAEAIRKQTDGVVPYWESVLSAAWASTSFDAFAAEAVRHDSDQRRDTPIHVTAEELSGDAIKREIESLPADHVLALDSRCILSNGSHAHLPLMDFRMLPKATDAQKISMALRAIGQERGAILRSGQSYHYYGFKTLPVEQWVRFCAACLLLSPLSDSRFIAHRLLAGGAALRITASPAKPEEPRLEAWF